MERVEFILPQEEIFPLVKKQLENFFPTLTDDEERQLKDGVERAIKASVNNFSKSENKYFSRIVDGERVIRFNPFHSTQWMTFLYYLSHDLYKNSSSLCDKIYYINKIMHSVDLFYAIDLPEVWSAEHPLGSVMGRAKYSEGFFFYQGCTVGGTRDKEGNLFYPELEENVKMYANSSILGHCHIGPNVQIGAGALVKNQDVPADSIVFGQSPNLIIKKAHL